MRAIWKGRDHIRSRQRARQAVQRHRETTTCQLHQVHDEDGGRIRYQRRCEIGGKVVEYEDIDKAYDDGERTVVLTEEDLARCPAERSREIEVVEFVPSEQIDPIMFDRSYYLEPDSKSPKAYVLLRRTLEETDRTAIVQFALRQKTRLAALRVRGDVLMLQTLLWDDEVREADVPVARRDGARSRRRSWRCPPRSSTSFASDFDAGEVHATTTRSSCARSSRRSSSRATRSTPTATFGESAEEPAGGEVIDLMEALRRSVEKNRPPKGGAAKSKSSRSAAAAENPDTAADVAKADPRTAAPKRSSTARSTTTKSNTARSGAAKVAASKAGAQESGTANSGARKRAASEESDEKSTERRTRTRKGA